ncbi:uncharacterized protein V6R79_015699 [Siganus canaliculatus]
MESGEAAEWKGEGTWLDSPSGTVGGLTHARTCGGCSGSLVWRKCAWGGVGGTEQQQQQQQEQEQQQSWIRAGASIFDPGQLQKKGCGDQRAQLGQTAQTDEVKQHRRGRKQKNRIVRF